MPGDRKPSDVTPQTPPVTSSAGKKLFEKLNLSRPGSSVSSTSTTNFSTSDALSAKHAIATRLASAMPTSGSPIKIIEAFIAVNDITGLDRYLKKHTIRKDIINLAMQKALIQNLPEAVECLAENGADTSLTDQFGTTRIHFAMRGGGNPDVIIALVKHDANYKDWNQDGNFLIHWACQNESIDLVKLLIVKDKNSLNEPDGRGRLPIHVAAMHGRPQILEYLIKVLSEDLDQNRIPKKIKLRIDECLQEEDDSQLSISNNKKRLKELNDMGAANYLDDQSWTPMHHANTEEANNDYSTCIKILLNHGADLMLQTPQGKTPLDLAYGSGRSKVLIDILPTIKLVALLQHIDDIIPQTIREKLEQEDSLKRTSFITKSPIEIQETIKGRGITAKAPLMPELQKKDDNAENFRFSTLWRKILLNDDVDLLEDLRNSGTWQKWDNDFSFITEQNSKKSRQLKKKRIDDFETSQGLSQGQMVELFQDCYENGLGIYAYTQTYYGQLIRRSKNLLEVLKALTGLDCHKKLTTIDGIQIFRPFHSSILFLALICGRFRVAEALLRMRQFDILPVSLLIVFILRNIIKDPRFPENIRSELETFANLAEGIAVDVLSQVYLKDNTPKKSICRDFLNVPLKSFGDIALIDLCARAECSALLSLSCSQSVLDERWDGVLLFIPKHFRFFVRIIPPLSLIYIKHTVRKQRAKAVSEAFANAATSNNVNTSGTQAVTSKNSEVFNAFQTPGVKFKRPKVYTIVEEMADQYSWKSTNSLNLLFAILRCPSVKFLYHSFFHVVFLMIFSYVLLVDLYDKISIPETICLLYMLGFTLEEGRQIGIEYLRDGCIKYFHDMWNWSDLAAIIFSILGFCLRLQIKIESTPGDIDQAKYFTEVGDATHMARLSYLCAMSIFYIRTLYITSILKIIGPRLKMMFEMMKRDLLPLLVVFVIFIMQFGVFSQAIMYPNMMDEKNRTLSITYVAEQSFIRAFYCIFEVTSVFDKSADSYEEGKNFVNICLMVLYTASVNMILLNLVIALFSNTVSRIEEQSTAHWLAERYEMVMEFHDRSIFPPPFNLFSIIYEIIWFLNRHKCCKPQRRKGSTVTNNSYRQDTTNMRQSMFDTKNITMNSSESGSDSDCLKIIGANFGPGQTEEKKKKIETSRFMTENDIQWFSGMRSRAADLSLKFILVQSFSLKNKRNDLGFMTSSQSFFKNEKSTNNNLLNDATLATPNSLKDSIGYSEFDSRLEKLESKIDKILTALANHDRFPSTPSSGRNFGNVILNPVPLSDRNSKFQETQKQTNKLTLPVDKESPKRSNTEPSEKMTITRLELKIKTPP